MKTKEELRPTTPLDSTAKDGGGILIVQKEIAILAKVTAISFCRF
ncbi:hypothetical protein [Enterococcus hirae]|nr:hypothetical protein [Enterococcus hirae]